MSEQAVMQIASVLRYHDAREHRDTWVRVSPTVNASMRSMMANYFTGEERTAILNGMKPIAFMGFPVVTDTALDGDSFKIETQSRTSAMVPAEQS